MHLRNAQVREEQRIETLPGIFVLGGGQWIGQIRKVSLSKTVHREQGAN